MAITHYFLLKQSKKINLPKQILIEELKEETKSPWWNIVGCTPSRSEKMNQLIIYIEVNTFDYKKVQMSSFQTGLLAEKFSPGYDRYLLSFSSTKSYKSMNGWTIFRGDKLKKNRSDINVRLEDYRGVIENDLIFFIPKIKLPEFVFKVFHLFLGFKIQYLLKKSEIKEKLGIPEITVREAKIHRNAWGCVLSGSIIITVDQEHISKTLIKKTKKKIMKKALSYARAQASNLSIERYLLLGYARIHIFSEDYRIRHLSNFGLKEELICTLQIKRISRIQSADIGGSTIEISGKYRIAWNKAWLEAQVKL